MAEETPIERLDPTEPDLQKYISELEQAQVDAYKYLDRIERARNWWHCNWPGQSYDGRRHGEGEQERAMPWEGASDSRLRIVSTLVDEFRTIAKTAFWGSRLQCNTLRPIIYGRSTSIAQKVLEWYVYTHMRKELKDELPLAYGWKFGLGLAFMGIEWEQISQTYMEKITFQDLLEIGSQINPELPIALGGTEEEEQLIVDFLQGLSPVLETNEARKIVKELRNEGESEFPVVNFVVNKPKWTALLPAIDILFPSETYNISVARFTDRRELVDEWELTNRIDTDGYGEDFVTEALKHKGEFADFLSYPNWRYSSSGSERDMIELHHFLHFNVENGVPCLYRTIFNQAVAPKGLTAVNKVFEYKHQTQPYVALRFKYNFRPLLTSIGIAEEAYTDEMDIKMQQDGITDHTELIHNPPMVTPPLSAKGLQNQYGPRAMMTTLRPREVQWAPLPPIDETPVAIIQMVEARLDRRYFGVNEKNPQLAVMRLQEIAQDVHTEIEMMLTQTLQLAQDFCTDEDVKRVAGTPQNSFNVSAKDIQGQFEISVTMNMQLSDIEYRLKLVGLYKQALSMSQTGSPNLPMIEKRLFEVVDPDVADLLTDDQQTASQREIDQEDAASAQILVGIEPRFPITGNHQLRAQRLAQNTFKSQNPEILQRIHSSKQIQKLIQTRLKNFANQIQQHQVNPQIGREVATRANARSQPAELTGQGG